MNNQDWEVIIGLEVHAQILSKTKLFSTAPSSVYTNPNTDVSLLDLGMPGTLPVLNEYCVQQVIKAGLALNCVINSTSFFDRKNYFYPDLPHGYQITQFYVPIAQNGYINIDGMNTVRINRIHLEQDTGVSIHDCEHTFIDLNRSGVALMEIVTEADIRSSLDAARFIKSLCFLLRYIGSSSADMSNGSMRCDVNVSVKRFGSTISGARCEVKNLNSTKEVINAIDYEVTRQIDILSNNKKLCEETRLYDSKNDITLFMRFKESVSDYMYCPDPDLLPVTIDNHLVEELRFRLPELPEQKFIRYVSQLKLKRSLAKVLVADKHVAEYFEEAVYCDVSFDKVANWICTELFYKLKSESIQICECAVTPAMMNTLIFFLERKIISGKVAKVVFVKMFDTGIPAENILKDKGLLESSDIDNIRSVVAGILTRNCDLVQKYKAGKKKVFSFFVGQVMNCISGRVNPSVVSEVLKNMLDCNC